VQSTSPQPCEHDLVLALRAGDEHVFRELVDRYHTALVRLAMSLVGDRSSAEDIAQDTWLGMIEGLERFGERSSLRTWLFHILVNCARAHRRSALRSISFSSLMQALDGDNSEADLVLTRQSKTRLPESPEQCLVAGEVVDQIDRAVRLLPPRQRTIFTHRDIEGRSSRETSALVGISAANERVLLHRARVRVRRELAGWHRPK
jgi:RNA polymerase sigma-70 factor, ECF subfamily